MCVYKYFIFTIKVFIMVFIFTQSPVWIGFLNKVFSVVTEEVMYHNDTAKRLQLTSNIQKKPQKNQVFLVNLVYLVFSKGSKILVFTPMTLTCILTKCIFLQYNIQPSFGTGHLFSSKESVLLLS